MVAVSLDRKSTRLNSSHHGISYAVFCLKKRHRRRQDTSTTWHPQTPSDLPNRIPYQSSRRRFRTPWNIENRSNRHRLPTIVFTMDRAPVSPPSLPPWPSPV